MPIITVDDRPFELDTLSDEAKQQLGNLAACDQEIGRLNAQLAIVQTARAVYARALQEALPKH